jgi:hypothetical protein
MSNLHEAIEAAFRTVPHPGDDNLTVYNTEGRDCDETFQLLKDTVWTNLPITEFMQGDTPFIDLTSEAFHYFMPAFLIASLDDTLEVDVSDALVFHLSPECAKQTEGEFPYDNTAGYNDRMALFNSTQRRVIIAVLNEFVRREWFEADEIAKIIDRLGLQQSDA